MKCFLPCNVFESIVEKVIVGGFADPTQPEPHRLKFIYKTGFINERGEAPSLTLNDTS